MSVSIVLPLAEYHVCKQDFAVLVGALERFSEDLAGLMVLPSTEINVGSGSGLAARADALSDAIRSAQEAGELVLEGSTACMNERLVHLQSDVRLAPNLIGDPTVLVGVSPVSIEDNIVPLVNVGGRSWNGMRYVLGVLLAECYRQKSLLETQVASIDEVGSVELDSDEALFSALRHASEALLNGSSGRELASTSGKHLASRTDETSQIRRLLDVLGQA